VISQIKFSLKMLSQQENKKAFLKLIKKGFCRPPCTIFELIYNGPKAIGKHCCLIISTLGHFIFMVIPNKKWQYEN